MSGFRSKARLADAILRVEEDPTRIIDLVREFVQANVPGEGKEFANAILDFIALIPPEHVTLILEFLQLMLDIVGLFPGLGEPADLANAAISTAREEYLDAAISVVSMLPFVGAVPGLGKALSRINLIITLISDLPAGFRQILLDLLFGIQDELMSFAISKIPDIVRGLKRRIGEAAEKMRFASKSGKEIPLPSSKSVSKSPTDKPAWEPEPIPVEASPSSIRPSSTDIDSSPKPPTNPGGPPIPSPKQTKSKPTKRRKSEKPKVNRRSSSKRKSSKKRTKRKKTRARQKDNRGNARNRSREPLVNHPVSGSQVVLRRGTRVETFVVNNREVTLYGSTHSTSNTPGHDAEIKRKALEMVYSGEYDYVLMQRSWRTATGRVSTDRKIPDIIGVRRDGKANAYEVRSKRQTRDELEGKLQEGMDSLPEERRGVYDVLEVPPSNVTPIDPRNSNLNKSNRI